MISNTRDIDTSRRCKFCDVVLTDENQYPSMRKRGSFVCKMCHKQKCVERYKKNPEKINERNKKWRNANLDACKRGAAKWQKENVEKCRAATIRHQRKIGMKPMGENKECGIFLGVHVAERVLAKVFKNVERMPFGNVGYDFICNNGYKIDVKSACIGTNGGWGFHIGENKIADYFILIAFDNRDDLTPLHLWMIPGEDVNDRKTIAARPSTISKWGMYKMPIDKTIKCCDSMR